MSIFGTLDCSFSSQVLQKAKARGYSMLLHPTQYRIDSNALRRDHFPRTSPITKEISIRTYEGIFIGALVQAGRCGRREHHYQRRENGKPAFSSLSPHDRITSNRIQRRSFCANTRNQTPNEAAAEAGYNVSRDELRRLVDYYPPHPDESETAPTYTSATDGAEKSLPSEDNDQYEILRKPSMVRDHLRRLLEDKESPHEEIFSAYQELPYPRASQIPKSMLRSLLHHLSVVENKSHTSMLRYISVIEDAKSDGIPLTVTEWTSAIAFTGRCLKKISAADVETSLSMWREMENEAGVQANNVTFNVLFDIASKAGKFVLAEMIMKEMQRRNLPYNRYFRTGLIYHYGLRADGDGVRRAYRELVEAGEIVDAAVIACVIASLLKCGEAVAAEQVFERAKHMHAQKSPAALPPPPPQHWRERRDLGRFLERAASRLRGDAEAVKRLQDTLSLAPDFRAYKALVYYHAVTAGDLDRVTELVAEMDYYGVMLHGSIFLYLFKGFGMHGGVLYTSWTRRRLENSWAAFRRALDGEEQRAVYLSRAAVVMVLRAFAKCAPYERTLDVWDEAKRLWQRATEDDVRFVEDLLMQMHDRDDDAEEDGVGEDEGDEDAEVVL